LLERHDIVKFRYGSKSDEEFEHMGCRRGAFERSQRDADSEDPGVRRPPRSSHWDGTPTSSQSYRDVEELLAERGIEVDHVTIYRWVQRFTPLLAEAARPCRHAVGDRWFVDETTSSSPGSGATSTGRSTSSARSSTCLCRHAGTSRRPAGFFGQATKVTKVAPVEVTTDQAATYPIVLEDLLPAARHPTDQYANNRVECDHGRLKSWLRPMRGLNQDRSARIVIAGHSLVQNLRRGHYEVAVEEPVSLRVAVAFAELALAI